MVAADDEEAAAAAAEDEFASHFARSVPPSLLVTTSRRPHAPTFAFLSNLLETLPNATFYGRKAFGVAQIISYATARGFTNVAFFNEGRKFSKGARLDALLLVHLPTGPTAHFRLSNAVLTADIKGHGRPSNHVPELILNNFTTALGHRVGRLFASLLPPAPQFAGRRVVTLHNQRDYIFFRHHRYVFETPAGSAKPAHTGHLAPAVAPPPVGTSRAVKKLRRAAAAAGDGEDGEEGEGGDGNGKAKWKGKGKTGAGGPPVVARLQELGPRFTLKLLSLQRGLFDPKKGEFEWVRPPPGDAAGASRRRFAL